MESLASDEHKEDLTQVFDKSGVYELEIEFNPASTANINIDNGRIELEDGSIIPAKIRSSDPTLKRWLQQACSLLGAKIHLVPDTNVNMRLYYTNYLRDILIGDYGRSMSISIPRLGILEMENMYNNNKPSSPPPFTAKQVDKDSYMQNEKRKRKQRRISFQSIGEILSMKNDGATILPAIDTSLIRSFTPEAGKGNADALIRKEISSCKPHLIESIMKPGKVETSNIAFLTCDLMNSLAAIAEDLNTIYFYRLEDTIRLVDWGYKKLSRLIFNTAIHFGECDITARGKGKERRHKCKGTWSGKSVYDWQNNIVDIISP